MTNLTLSHKSAATLLQVKHLSEQDIPLALELIASIKESDCLKQPHHLKPRDAAELIELVEHGYPLLGIKDSSGKLVSFATVSPADDDSFIIRSLCTSPDYQGEGCGKKIIKAAMAWISEQCDAQKNPLLMKAKVSADNSDSLELFTKAGFVYGDLEYDADEHYAYYMMTMQQTNNAATQEFSYGSHHWDHAYN